MQKHLSAGVSHIVDIFLMGFWFRLGTGILFILLALLSSSASEPNVVDPILNYLRLTFFDLLLIYDWVALTPAPRVIPVYLGSAALLFLVTFSVGYIVVCVRDAVRPRSVE